MKKRPILIFLILLLSACSIFGGADADTQYVAELTVDEVMPTATPQPTPAATPAPASEATSVPADETAITPEPEAVTEPEDDEDPAAEDMSDPVDEPTLEPELVVSDDGVLRSGSKGDSVKALQQALYDKGYLSEEPDGYYGTQTKGAVIYLQFLNDLPLTGEADNNLVSFLFSDQCPDAVGYPALDYNRVSNNPDAYKGDTVSIYGRVLQTISSSSEIGLRVATRGAYEDVIYVVCENNEENAALKESDRIAVYGTNEGTFSYKNASGKHITLPCIRAELIVVG